MIAVYALLMKDRGVTVLEEVSFEVISAIRLASYRSVGYMVWRRLCNIGRSTAIGDLVSSITNRYYWSQE